MKSFASILTESKKTYDFKVRIANAKDLSGERLDKIERALEAYELNDMSKPKTVPVQSHPVLFPNLGPCEVHVFDVSLNYPCITDQIQHLISGAIGMSAGYISVLPKGFDESQLDPSFLKEITKIGEEGKEKKAILVTEPEVVKNEKDLYGDKFIASFLKDLTSMKHEFAGEKTPKAKTTNDEPMNTVSPLTNKTKR